MKITQIREKDGVEALSVLDFGIYTLFTLIFKKLTFMIINFKLFVIFAPNIRIRLDFSNRSNDI